jgi:oligoribonuclease (3'-5' exoribonuclease)
LQQRTGLANDKKQVIEIDLPTLDDCLQLTLQLREAIAITHEKKHVGSFSRRVALRQDHTRRGLTVNGRRSQLIGPPR